jgi:hypothetical protein
LRLRPLPLAWPGRCLRRRCAAGTRTKVAWAEPSERLMVPTVPVTPEAVVGPLTGGQVCAHVPLQVDLVGVSGANEYSVKPPGAGQHRPAADRGGLQAARGPRGGIAGAGAAAAAGGGCAWRTARRQYRRGCGGGQQCQQHPQTTWAAGDSLRAVTVASSWCDDFLSFVPGVSVPALPDGLGGDDRLAGAAGSAVIRHRLQPAVGDIPAGQRTRLLTGPPGDQAAGLPRTSCVEIRVS